MTVTVNTPLRIDGQTWQLSWSSNLSDPVYRIFQDGLLVNTTQAETQIFSLSPGETLKVEILDDASEPAQGFPGRFLMTWYGGSDTDHYRIDEYISGAWTQQTTIPESGKGFYSYKTRFLEDITEHRFRVMPVGVNGNDGAALEMKMFMVREPDPPDVTYTYSSVTGRVTIAEA